MRENTPQRDYPLREIFNSLPWIVCTASLWRYMPNELPPWQTVYQQTQRWIKAGIFEDMETDLRALIRLGKGKAMQPTTGIFGSRTIWGSVQSCGRAG